MIKLLAFAPLALLALAALVVALAEGAAALARLLETRPGDDVADMRGYGDPGPYEHEADDPGDVIDEFRGGIPGCGDQEAL